MDAMPSERRQACDQSNFVFILGHALPGAARRRPPFHGAVTEAEMRSRGRSEGRGGLGMVGLR